MKMTALKDITLTGEPAYRIGRNFSRLEDPLYRPESIFQADQQGWPGDWEGRTLLALSFHAQITRREPAWLEEILTALESEWNPQGYLKEIYLPERIDEQQLSGHNWLLRGLLELSISRGEDRFVQRAKTIVENLYLPLLGRFSTYPTEERGNRGGAAGHITQTDSSWRLSTDIGCAFISLDALGQHYGLFGGERLRSLLWEMLGVFESIDPEVCQLQTHATLSALRGILRFYEAEKDPRLLELVRQRFRLYLDRGQTLNYANYNWFGRPSWTEPCAIVDSMMVATHLFRLTGEGEYITLANRIYYNALLASQRPNGGFGCDICPGTEAANGLITGAEGAWEAYWCCSMRGAEGLTFASAATLMTRGNHIYITDLRPGTYRQGDLTVTIQTRYPWEDGARITFRGAGEGAVLHLYMPENIWNIDLRVNGGWVKQAWEPPFLTFPIPAEGEILYSYHHLPLHQEDARGAFTLPGTKILRRGDQIYAKGPNKVCFLCDRIYEAPEEPGTLRL